MKPVKLIISGWGPYKNTEEIDFSALSARGIFLITGQTGAGKTTIFDAITYALYGDLSGSLRQKASVRSDFADAATPTFVDFSMEHDGSIYRIRRNPEYQRPRKRKGGKEAFVAEKENAVLWFEDGTALEGNREVNEKIREILRLDLRQFKQISMIAQGEFAQLLHAGGEEKMKIFREIFGTSVYDLFLKKLKERAAEQEKRAMEFSHRMEEDVRLFSTEDQRFLELTKTRPYPYREIGELLFIMEKEAAGEAEKVSALSADLEAENRQLAAQLALAEQINGRFEQLEKQKLRHSQLLEQKEEMDGQEARCLRAEAAAKVREIHQQARQADADLARLLEQQEKMKAQQKALADEQEGFQPAAEKESEVEGLFALQEQEKTAREQEKQAVKALEVHRQQLEEKQQAYLAAEQEAQEKQQAYEALQRAKQRSLIGLVASWVQEGEPCPVCGSLHHPAVAKEQDGPDEKTLKAAQKEMETARKQEMKCHGQARAALELWEKQEGEAKKAKNARQEAVEAVEQAQKNLEEICRLFGEWPKPPAFRQKIRRYHETAAEIGQIGKNLEQLAENSALFSERQRQLESRFQELKEQLGFSQDPDWQEALLEEMRLTEMKQAVKGYQEQLRTCQELISHLEAELAGKAKMDTAGLKDRAVACQAQLQELSDSLTKLRLQQHSAGRTARSLSENQKKSGDALAVYGVVKDLENMASGNNPRRLVFEQYVLAGYFEEILRAANLRLKHMSGGRYELFRADRVSDGRKKDSLEIEVMDYYTGRRRSVRTLSGGETFKASLALALGLSDAVCAASGGVKVDTLFIDEGFGALDSESLDQACTALMTLAGENRLIGIISHVAELKERIPAQIRVEKETAGSRIRVVS